MISIQTIREQKYNVQVGINLWDEVNEFLGINYSADKVILVIDENVKKLYGLDITQKLEKKFDIVCEFVVPTGESSKSIQEWTNIMNFALENGARRNTPLLAFGGGVTGDLSGFAAASIMRGIPFIQFPTTLLAMVDSSIGGKTGINHYTGKNLIGAFYQPDAVFSQVDFLSTLPEKEWMCGLGEVLKYGAISDVSIFDKALFHLKNGHIEIVEQWVPLIEQCASIKADLVQKDEQEAGIRAYLNFGHTFAHAIEAFMNYEGMSHGEAVYAGMIAAAFSSNLLGAQLDSDKLLQFKPYYKLDLSTLKGQNDELINLMFRDKKMRSNKLRLVLLKDWEKPYTIELDDTSIVDQAWNYLFEIYT